MGQKPANGINAAKLIFGLKLKHYRTEKGWSLAEFSDRTGVSASYLNEIEKGKKYPKPDKISVLAETLGIDYDTLVSTTFEDQLDSTSKILKSGFFSDIPLEFFGIEPGNLAGIIANAPLEFTAFLNTLVKIGKSYNVGVESFYFAVLRSYLEIHKNYFPELEHLAETFQEDKTEAGLKKYLREEHKLYVDIFDPKKHPALANLRTVLVPKTKKLFLNNILSKEQRLFALARETGFRFLNIKVRPLTSTWVYVNSFDEVFNNFKASYFASCILIPKEKLNEGMHSLFSSKKITDNKLLRILDSFPVSHETIFYRMFSLLPAFFDIQGLYFLKFESAGQSKEIKLTKEIHLVKQHDPQEAKNQNYCRRWPGLSVLEETKESRVVKFQISEFEKNRYFEISIGRPTTTGKESVTLGLEINPITQQKIKFLQDPNIVTRHVGQTCEKCSIFDCKERVAAPSLLQRKRIFEEISKAMEQLK